MMEPIRYVAAPPTLVDRAIRLGLVAGFRAYRLWHRVRPVRRPGVAVMVWFDGALLAVRHSYRPGLDIPGGRRGRGESMAEAASRELAEELGLAVRPDDLVYLRKRRNTHLFELRLAERPDMRPDSREILEAMFLAPDEAGRRSPALRGLLRDHRDMA